ncbi:MAG: hypothetical protein NVSMB5_03320 [Candidatus Velthaea sp.]
MVTRLGAAICSAGISSILLAGCGGGGSGAPGIPAAAKVAPTKAQTATSTRTVFMNERQQQISARFVKPGRTATLGLRRVMLDQARRPLGQRAALGSTTSACQDGVIETVTANADGSSTVTDNGYYDSACLQPALIYTVTTTVSAADVNGVVSAHAVQTNYQPDGTTVAGVDVLDFVAYNSTPGSGNFVIRNAHFASLAASQAATPVALGTDYYAELEGSGKITIGTASLQPDSGNPGQTTADVGISTVATSAPDASGNVTITSQGSGTSYVDPSGKMSIAFPVAAAQTAWQLSGGTATGSYTDSDISKVDNAGVLLAYSENSADVVDDITTSFASINGGLSFTGTVTQTSTGVSLAKFAVDADGNGTVTYTDGTTAVVQNWCFQQ